tara:strand:+ start:11409 stop:12539 length:1131 start_codon:yes stop_codon:yes gene_type:complete
MEKTISTTQLFNADCLDKMKDIDDDSVDLIFCDLPYNQTSCKWDIAIDLELFWIQVMRIKKLHTPIFFTTTTKFGVSLIQSAPKKCFFRYDLVWVKSASAGFLNSKRAPLRKHEMIYVFYEKLPYYDLSSHTHKFLKPTEKIIEYEGDELCKYDVNKNTYGGGKDGRIKVPKDKKYHEAKYDPPLPVSVVKELDEKYKNKGGLYSKVSRNGLLKAEPHYDPPLPVSVVKEDKHTLYGEITDKGLPHTSTYDPPLPVSVVKEEKTQISTIYGGALNGDDNADKMYQKQGRKNNESVYEPPLPNTMLEIKSTRGNHSTEKPVALMEWIFKYYTKEGDVILDPTMGSGSTGIACKNMNRNFIGIEMDEEIFKVAENRLL